jgi:6-phosphofructokinase 2
MIVTLTLNPCIDKVIELDCLAPGREVHARAVAQAAAGKGINVSRMVRTLGGETLALWTCGGFSGERMRQLLVAEGLANIPLAITGEPRTNYTLAERGGRSTRIYEPGPAVSEAEAASIREETLRRVAAGDLLVLSGSVPCASLEGFYAELIRLVRARGVRVILDSRDEALRRALPQGPYLVKANQEEAQQATGQPVGDLLSALDAARLLLKCGATFAAVSLGRAGAVLRGPGESWLARSPQVEIASSVGSGDCLVAAMALGIAGGRPVADWLRWGVAAGAANATVWLPAACRRDAIERLLPQVKVSAHPIRNS